MLTTSDLEHAIVVMTEGVKFAHSDIDGTLAGDYGYPPLTVTAETLLARCVARKALEDANENGVALDLAEHGEALTEALEAIRWYVQDQVLGMIELGGDDEWCADVNRMSAAVARVDDLLREHRESD